MTQIHNREQLTLVIVGHVDHGKSTIIGRLLADTDSLPKGKLDQVRINCEKNSKPFEYAFLLDALKDEQAQGITIDSARCFFKTKTRDYIIIDAPGHVEFIKNMVTGASRAEAAFIVIDAKEGIQENSKKHAFLLSMLGIKEVVVLVNKIDLIDFQQERFENIKKEYENYLSKFHIHPMNFIPISAREGINIISVSEKTSWYQGMSVLEQLKHFHKEEQTVQYPFRFSTQDVYKFTKNNDDRRIIAGIIETGTININDPVIFYPSGKKSTIKSIERFNSSRDKNHADAEEAIGFTISDHFFIKAGELMVKKNEQQPYVSNRFKVNMFWLGSVPMFKDKEYKLKISSLRTKVKLKQVLNVLDASELTIDNSKHLLERHDIAEVILETEKPVTFDLIDQIKETARFVIVDDYEIAGGGVILDNLKDLNEVSKEDSNIESSLIKSLNPETDSKIFSGIDSHFRSLLKAFSWRTVALITTSIIAWKLTGKLSFAIMMGFSDSLVKIFLYYFHERIWANINFGKSNSSPFRKGGGI